MDRNTCTSNRAQLAQLYNADKNYTGTEIHLVDPRCSQQTYRYFSQLIMQSSRNTVDPIVPVTSHKRNLTCEDIRVLSR